jgi:hypothetical protein
MYPEDCIEVLRSRPFSFSARSCNKWALGRVILLGDAAHVFPPCKYVPTLKDNSCRLNNSTVGGQGISSGFRDAVALAWRLTILCSSNRSIEHEQLLTSWYEERKQQLDKSLETTVRNENIVNGGKNVVQNLIRNWTLWLLQLIPYWKHRLELGPRADGPMRYSHLTGMPFIPKLDGGYSFPQTYCRALPEGSQLKFTDDVIFASSKNKIFQIVVLLSGLDQMKHALDDLDGIGRTTDRLSTEEATFFIPRKTLLRSANNELPQVHADRAFRTATASEFAESNLCLGRPRPRDYNEVLMWQSVGGKRFVILRPDRFIFAACNTAVELEQAARSLAIFFPIRTQ